MQVPVIGNMLRGVNFITKHGIFTAEFALFLMAVKLEPLNGVTAMKWFYLIS